MKTRTIEMPDVSRCDIAACAYNNQSNCGARAITIGDGSFPGCDTFLGGTSANVKAAKMAGVGACKVGVCKHNVDFDCQADAIVITAMNAPPACQSFSA